ncbi:MAG: threonine/serine exporter family protein [Clostridiales bacterium]|nr:threonine/serine exporter family protein [Clostridiales bacterium]
MLKDWILPLLWAASGSIGFAFIYHMRGKKLWFNALGGAMTWLVYLFAMEMKLNESLCYAIAAGVGTLYSEIMARALKTPVTTFVIAVNIPMIPGGSLFYSLLGLLENDMDVFVQKGKYALGVSVALAMGIFVATMIFRLVRNMYSRRRAY